MEGLRLTVYDDATGRELKPGDTIQGYPSVGYGRNLTGKGISHEEADFLFSADYAECLQDIQRIFEDALLHLELPRLAVLLDMRFNLGPQGFRGFKKFIEAVKNCDWTKAAFEMRYATYPKQNNWYVAHPQRSDILINMIKSGEWKEI